MPINKTERTKINKAIVELTKVGAASVNYVAYTATPYANFLNEAYPESLYPQDFIIALPQSDEHFGPEQIFGIEGSESTGLGIVQEITSVDLVGIRKLHAEPQSPLPRSLEDAICWFLCAAACMRCYGGKIKPISMLIHTSQGQGHHTNVADAVRRFVGDTPRVELLTRCRSVWVDQTTKFSMDDFKDRLPKYGRISELRDYRPFEDLVPHLRTLLDRVTRIPLNEEGSPAFHQGIHLCIDNCASNSTDENELKRLVYPTEEQAGKLEAMPAFIVVGGSTLARGLTIENLVSSYFLRATAQIDTLMQMGRWFGYRQGYELLPRIWMPEDTQAKFVYMAGVEQELRADLERFEGDRSDPKEFGPRVKVHPSLTWLRPTIGKKMQGVRTADFDFSSIFRATTVFHDGVGAGEILTKNIQTTEAFLASLGSGAKSWQEGAHVWAGVPLPKMKSFLENLIFHKRARFFADIQPFIQWLDKNVAAFDDWNVVVAGPGDAEKSKGTQRL